MVSTPGPNLKEGYAMSCRFLPPLMVPVCFIILLPATASPAALKDESLPYSTVDLSGQWSFAYTRSHAGTVSDATAFGQGFDARARHFRSTGRA